MYGCVCVQAVHANTNRKYYKRNAPVPLNLDSVHFQHDFQTTIIFWMLRASALTHQIVSPLSISYASAFRMLSRITPHQANRASHAMQVGFFAAFLVLAFFLRTKKKKTNRIYSLSPRSILNSAVWAFFFLSFLLSRSRSLSQSVGLIRSSFVLSRLCHATIYYASKCINLH